MQQVHASLMRAMWTGLMHATTTPWLQLFLKDVVVWVKTGNANTQHTAMAWNQSMKHAMHLSDAHLVTYTFCRTSNNNCSPQTQGPYASLLSSFLFLSGNKGSISGGFNRIWFKVIFWVNSRKKKSSTAKALTIPLKQVRVWMFLAYVGEGAYKRDSIAEFLLILVVSLFSTASRTFSLKLSSSCSDATMLSNTMSGNRERIRFSDIHFVCTEI